MAFHLDLGLAPPSEVRVRSSTPGRLRLAVPGLRWNEVLAQKLEERLHESEGVLDVTVTLATGHVLVIYDPARTDPGRLETGARELAPPAPARRTPATAAWHALSVDEVLERVEATRDGLTPDEALRRLREVGPNAVIDVKPRSSLRLALEQLASRPVLLLSGASGLSFVIGDTLEGVAMALAVATNVAIGFTTERRAEELIRG
ncbi:MAG TPA: cation-transporting P-type ATPase, partial [Planctomycetota bacterium]|nr:cation-transporting P-type ATPase [Planctomycetota bacterium]